MDIATVLCQLIAYGLIYFLMTKSLSAYALKKGENLATKEDIAVITKIIESEKALIQQKERYDAKKYELKYMACMDALEIVDAHLSRNCKIDNDGKPFEPDVKHITTDMVRNCHSKLILSLDNQAVVDIFLEIIVGQPTNIFDSLNEIRALIRAELGFVGDAYINSKYTWIAKVGS